MRTLQLIAIILILGCSSVDKKIDLTEKNTYNPVANSRLSENKIHLHKSPKLSINGDFDGDGNQDTIHQGNFSKLRSIEIDSSADPSRNEWDTVVKWFYDEQSDVYLTINKNNQDTLHLGTAQGLYCLLNIGDNNSDGKDEIAFVVDYCDFSRVNSCKIYTVCNNRWTNLKQFEINEEAFDFTSDTMRTFTIIKGYLENKNGKMVLPEL